MTSTLVWVPLAYLLGSIPTGYLLGKILKGIDIREHGSGNPGATNVFRVVGKGAGIATLIIDGFKGFLPVQIVLNLMPQNQWLALLTGLSAIVGHNWSIFLRFRGGKGVATSAGLFLALIPVPTLIAMSFFLAALLITKHVSVGSMVGVISLCVSTSILTASTLLTLFTIFCALIILFSHRKNIHRLFLGQEPKIVFKNKE